MVAPEFSSTVHVLGLCSVRVSWWPQQQQQEQQQRHRRRTPASSFKRNQPGHGCNFHVGLHGGILRRAWLVLCNTDECLKRWRQNEDSCQGFWEVYYGPFAS
ncbi:unnamed protein product [Pleuronectes platessa]|uniref:Uncharacterized protein n=1 Tax=Pleuronectes platessa TaxID=8262 RepID=A0A9N7TUK3_PLEPL|nr:unnamed protein product [Pleuronectes platessa]